MFAVDEMALVSVAVDGIRFFGTPSFQLDDRFPAATLEQAIETSRGEDPIVGRIIVAFAQVQQISHGFGSDIESSACLARYVCTKEQWLRVQCERSQEGDRIAEVVKEAKGENEIILARERERLIDIHKVNADST